MTTNFKIGVDIGSSFTKIFYIQSNTTTRDRFPTNEKNLITFLNTKLSDLISSTNSNIIIEFIGSGSYKFRTTIEEQLKRFPQVTVIFGEEFSTNAISVLNKLQNHPQIFIQVGGKNDQNLDEENKFIIASLGTGTTFTYYDGQITHHIGGSALGGGTFLGLSKLIFNQNDFPTLYQMAQQGKHENVDLMISDLVGADYISNLTSNVVASSMAKAAWIGEKQDEADDEIERPSDNDIASSLLASLSMSIGCQLSAACSAYHCSRVILIGGFMDHGGIISQNVGIALNLFMPDVKIFVPSDPQFIGSEGAVLDK